MSRLIELIRRPLTAAACFIACTLLLVAPRPAAAQLTGGLEGEFIHHVFELTPGQGQPKVVAEAWAHRKTGALWVVGRVDPRMLAGALTLRSQGTDDGPPAHARSLSPQKAVLEGPAWLKSGHVWSREADGVADTGLKLVLDPLCRDNCSIVAVEQYHLPGSEGMAGAKVKLSAVDRYPLEAGDRVTVFAPR